MSPEIVVWMLGICLVLCLLLLIQIISYFLKEWKKMETILESFQNGDRESISRFELLETRESKMVNRIFQILNSARFKEERAVGEKNQVMELISNLSHQLKTPLANIVMNMELLRGDTLTGQQREEFLVRTGAQAEKMQFLMDSLLKASRLENGMIQFRAENAGIKKTIAKAVGAVYAQASAKQIALSIEEFSDFTLYHNPKWTAEAMTNILENAIKYSRENSRIQISLFRMDIYTRITVTDEGIGIPEKEYPFIFRRFYRGKAVEQQEGSGLGLYLAQLILQHEKGYITVSSKLGRGSSFHIFLLNSQERTDLLTKEKTGYRIT